ncbi:MAG TPA: hypothetical protein VFQ89_07970 [Candidatus Binatia bacterium]|nr:hypothetical protein [Candidatus Binatia bacterium]
MMVAIVMMIVGACGGVIGSRMVMVQCRLGCVMRRLFKEMVHPVRRRRGQKETEESACEDGKPG